MTTTTPERDAGSDHAASGALAGAGAGKYAETPFQIPLKGWWPILKRVYARFIEADISIRCAGVAFFTFFSIFPAIAASVLTYGLFLDRQVLRTHLGAIEPFLPPEAFTIISDRLDALLAQPETGLGLGLLFALAVALWSGSRGIGSLVGLMSEAYRENDKRSFIVSALLSIGLTVGGIVFLAVAIVTVAALPAIFLILPFGEFFERLVLLLRWPLLFLFVMAALMVLYRLGPDRKDAQLVWLVPGAFISTVGWVLLSLLFSFYVENFGNFSATFGSLSVAVVTMLWLNYTILIFTLGALLNAEAEYQTRIDTTVGAPKPMGLRGAVVADEVPKPID